MNRIRNVVVLAALVFGTAATAQPGKKLAEEAPIPPTTNKLEEPNIILPYLVAFMLIGAVVGASAIPSKRGHQD